MAGEIGIAPDEAAHQIAAVRETLEETGLALGLAGEINAAEKVRIPTTCKVCLKIEFSVMDIDSSPDAINTKPQCIQIEKVTQYQKLA